MNYYMNSLNNSYLAVHTDALCANVAAIEKTLSPGAEIIPVLKCDAYGLSLSLTAPALAALPGIRTFALAHVSEGLALRALGIEKDALILGNPLPHAVPDAVNAHLTLTAGRLGLLPALAAAAEAAQTEETADTQARLEQLLSSMDGVGRVELMLTTSGSEEIFYQTDTRVSGDTREVELEGEAYFEVQHDEKMPFIVKTSKSDIRVYGTSFNVKAYPDDSFQKTTLEEGSIGLQVNDKEFKLVPNQQAVLNTANEVNIIKINARQQSVWRHGRFLFDNENLEDIMAQLARWYDVNIFFTGAKVKNLHFSGEIDRYEDIERVLHMIELTTNISFTINGKTITITLE